MTSEAESTNTQDNNNNNKQTNQDSIEQLDVKELIKIPFVKDLIVKVDVLKNGVLNERKKTTTLAKKIQELELVIKSKSEQVDNLIKEKNDLEKKLSEKEKDNKQNSPQVVAPLMANDEIRKLNEEIIKLKFENETFMKKLNSTLLESEDSKLEYKSQIKSLSETNNKLIQEIKTLKSEINNKLDIIKNLNSEKQDLLEKIRQSSSVSTNSMREKEHFEALLREYKKAKEEAIHQLNACLEKCSKLVIENKTYKDAIYLHETDAGKK